MKVKKIVKKRSTKNLNLHDLYGKQFSIAYLYYESLIEKDEIKLYKKISAVSLWRKMLGMLFETGHPWVVFKDPCNIRYTNQHVGVVHSSNLCCMTADQRVVTDKGILTVKELYNLKCQNKVVGLDGVYNASEMLLPRPDAPIVEIQTREGYSHKVTPDHKVWVKDKGWIEAQHLEANDKLLIQQLEGLWGKEHNPELSYSMGLIAGDGTFSKKSVHIDVWEHDFHFIQSIEKKVHNLLAGNTVLNTTSTNVPTFAFNHEHKRARLSSAPLCRLLAKKGLSQKNKTRVPELIWKGDRETVAEYLRGLYQADGHIQTGADITTLVLASKNLLFIKELQIIWANFGVKTSINKMRDPQWQTLPDGKGGTKDYLSQALYRLLITSIQGCKIAEDILHLGQYKQSDACERYKQNLQKKGYQQKLYAHFTELTPLPNEDAYCLMVDSETHAWTVNGLITKNTEITLHTDAEEIAVCFPKGTQILTKNGQKPIEYCNKEQVLVPFNNDLIPQQRFLTATLISQGKKQVYELTTKNGITICATEEHPFLIQHPIKDDKPRVYEWRKLKELEKGDFIVCPLTTPIYEDIGQQDADFTAAGWMLGDGWMSTSYGACFAPHETTAQNFVLPILERWHQESPLGNNTPHSAPPTPYTQPNGVINWHTQRQGFIDYVSERFGFHRAKGPEKYIAPQIKQANVNQIASFLSGLFSADGCVMNDSRRKKGGVSVTLSSASLQLLRDVQLLLKPFGIHGRIRGCSVKGRESKWQGIYEIKSKESVSNYARFIGFSLTPNKQEKLQELLAKLSSKSAFQHSALIDIVAKGEEEVFDLSLTEDHSFIANGLVVHNCNLGSVNLAAHTTNDGLDMPMLEKTITTATRMLDNVIEYNYYSVPQARRSNLQHRPVGLGLMGFQDALYKLNIPYATEAAVEFADRSMEAISYYAIQGSNKLAEERGKYSTYDGSLWSRGILPIDSLELMQQERGEYFQVDRSQTLDWDSLRDKINQHGMRNSNVMAIAPTACVSGDTLILSSAGLIPIASLVAGEAQWQNINVSIAQEGNLAHSDQLYLNGFKDTLRITTKRGSEITATPNHRIRVINEEGDYCWKYFSDLAVGDEVVRRLGGHQALLATKAPITLTLPQRLHHNEKAIQLPETLTTDTALMLGLYMGDGYLKYSNRGHYIKKEGLGFAIHDDETALIEHLRTSFSTWGATLLADVSNTESACTSYLVFSSQLVKWFELNQFNKQRGNFGEGSASAFIPEKVLQSNSDVLCAFLSGLFIADGTVNNHCVEMATVSRTLALQVKVALESLGIVATLSTSRPDTKGNRPVHRVRTSNVEATRSFLSQIGFGDSYKHQYLTERLAESSSVSDARRGHNIRSMAVITDFIQAARAIEMDKQMLNPLACSKTNGKMNISLAKQAIADYPVLKTTKLAKLLEKGNLYFEPIVSIEASQDITYDLQVPEKHTYVANGFVSHNTISNICGVSQSIEPTYQNMYVKSNLSGEFTVVNPYLINELKALNLWDDVMINDLKYFDGSVQKIDRIPENIKEKYATAFEIDSRWLVEAASRRQKWIDQGESLNLYLAEPSGKKLDDLYKLAWVRGLKTTYYLRTLAATHMEKSADSNANETEANSTPQVCSILDPDCEACQ